MKVFYTLTGAAFATIFAVAASAATLTNGNFETGNLDGWTVTPTANGETIVQDVTSFDVTGSGSSLAARFNVGRTSNSGTEGVSVSQIFSVMTAGLHMFSIDVAADNTPNLGGTNADGGTFELFVDGNLLDSFASDEVDGNAIERDSLSGALNLGVGSYTFEILITRRFSTEPVNPEQRLDNALIVGPDVTPVPLPASGLLLLTGLVPAVLMRRKRKA